MKGKPDDNRFVESAANLFIILTPYFQAALLKDKFQAALQNYQQVEQRQRNASKNQMERQYKIGEAPAFDHRMALTDPPSRLRFYSETRCLARGSEGCCQ